MTNTSRRITGFVGILVATAVCFWWAGPIAQDPTYHEFADVRTLHGIPNFWNVVSNLPFLVVAIYGAITVRAYHSAHAWVVYATAAVSFGSAWYHFHPDDPTLCWDRLPMAVLFMSLLAATIAERISPEAGDRVLLPLVAIGVSSVLFWRISGDLRLYALVQFGSILAVLILIASPSRNGRPSPMWWVIALYGLAKVLESMDHQIASIVETGGHPGKHAVAACAVFAYLYATQHRQSQNHAAGSCKPPYSYVEF